ncbi:hypothetical protein [Pantoea sp. R102]|uniref:hypothetical protein n=1 Tax=Pantoea sp. R102 TaxID=2507583 RepID=UPI0010A8370E|nr:MULTISPECIES: hypothetical protein [Pantoea]THD41343.1 hypothetical protein ERD80_01635 [Pantoea sp. R102]
MAELTLTPLNNTAFNGSFVNQLNNNLIKLADALNSSVLMRDNATTGQTSMHTDLDLNGFAILNATLGNNALPVVELIARLKQAEADIADLKTRIAAKG